MHEKYTTTPSEISFIRRIETSEPAFFNYTPPALDTVVVRGSIYLGDASDTEVRHGLDASSHRLDIIDLRCAPENEKGRVYDGQTLDSSIDYLITQGKPNWETGKGYKGLRQGEMLTIGRTDPISSERFNLASPMISRRHATVYVTEHGVALEDKGSANGTSYVGYENPVADLPQAEQGPTDRTEGRSVIAMSDTQVVEWGNYLHRESDTQYASMQRILKNPDLVPVVGVEVGDKRFLFSQIVRIDGDRKAAVGYASGGDDPGTLYPRLFYQSRSDGGWRSTPGVDERGNYSKGGDAFELGPSGEYGHYTQVTKPVEAVVAILEYQDELQEKTQREASRPIFKSLSDDEVNLFFNETEMNQQQRSELSDEATATRVEGVNMDAYISGFGFIRDHSAGAGSVSVSAREALRSMELPAGFEPDFSQEPSRAYRTSHTLAGPTLVEVFPAVLNSRRIDWHVAHDLEKNRVWVDRIVYQDAGVTSYGTQKEVILAGALSAKPFDYAAQLHGMEHGRDWREYDRSYVDVSPTLDQIPAIVRYRMQRKIFAI